jgi:hypothetical protein
VGSSESNGAAVSAVPGRGEAGNPAGKVRARARATRPASF